MVSDKVRKVSNNNAPFSSRLNGTRNSWRCVTTVWICSGVGGRRGSGWRWIWKGAPLPLRRRPWRRWLESRRHWLLVKLDDTGPSVSYLSPLFHTLSVQFHIPLSLCVCVCFRLPRSLRLTPSFLSLRLNPESAPGIREDLMFPRARWAREDLKFKV